VSKWEWVKLGDVCEMNPPKKELASVDPKVEVSFVPMADLQANQIHFEVRDAKKLCEVIKGYTYFKNNDVLLAKITPCFENGKSGVVTNLVNGIGFGSTEFIVFRPGEKVLPEWIYYCISNNKFLNAGKNNMTGSAGQQRISQKFIKDYKIPIPSVEEQKKIAKTLDTVAKIIKLRKKQLVELDNLIKSTFYDMFGDPGINPRGYAVVPMDKIIDYIGDIGSNGANATVSANLKMTDKEDYALMVRTLNFTSNNFKNNIKFVSKEVYNFFKKSQIFGGELIFNKIGSAGINFIMPYLNRPVSLGLNQIMVRTNEKVNIMYLHTLLNTDHGKHQINRRIQGAVTKSITKGAIKEMPILLPMIKLQNQFAEIITKVEEQKALVQEALNESQYLFDSLMSEYFE